MSSQSHAIIFYGVHLPKDASGEIKDEELTLVGHGNMVVESPCNVFFAAIKDSVIDIDNVWDSPVELDKLETADSWDEKLQSLGIEEQPKWYLASCYV